MACSQDKEAGRAVEKAIRRAHKPINMHYFELYDLRTVFHDVTTKFKRTKIIMMAAQEGTGLLVNNTINLICEAIGIQDLKAKIHGSHNTHNTVAAFWKALKLVQTPEEVARKRGKAVVDMASPPCWPWTPAIQPLFQKSWKVIVPFKSCELELCFSNTPPTHPLNCDGSHQRPATDRVGVVRQPALTPYTPLFQPPPGGRVPRKKGSKRTTSSRNGRSSGRVLF